MKNTAKFSISSTFGQIMSTTCFAKHLKHQWMTTSINLLGCIKRLITTSLQTQVLKLTAWPTLLFSNPLGDGWRIFQLAMGSQIATMSTSMLHAEIRAYDASNPKVSNPKSTSETTPSDQVR